MYIYSGVFMQLSLRQVHLDEQKRKSSLICIRFLTFGIKGGNHIIQIPRGKSIIEVAPKSSYAYILSNDHRPPSSLSNKRTYINGMKITIDQALQMLKNKPGHLVTTMNTPTTEQLKKLDWAVLSREVNSPIKRQGLFAFNSGDKIVSF